MFQFNLDIKLNFKVLFQLQSCEGDNKDIELALESLWIDAKAKVDVKVADTKFLMLRDVLLSTNGEGKQNYFFQIISERVILYDLTTLAQMILKYQFYLNS